MEGTQLKVVALNGSARKGGNTAILLRYVMKELEKEGIETELIEMSGANIHGCLSCHECSKKKDGRCSADRRYGQRLHRENGEGGRHSAGLSDICDRRVAGDEGADRPRLPGGEVQRRHVSPQGGAAVVAVRRAGAIHAFDTLNHFFLISEMIVPGSCYWNIGIGLEKGDVEKDEEGIRTMKTLGQNMAWLLKKLRG